MKKTLILIVLFLSIVAPIKVNAAGAAITGNTSITAGTRFSLTFAVTSTSNLVGVESVIAFNSNHFSIVSTTNLGSSNTTYFNTANRKYTDFWTSSPKNGTVSFLRVEFQARAAFTAGTPSTISMTNTFVTQGTTESSVPNRSVTITSVAPKSTVNTLSSISINGSNLSGFSPTTTSYTLPETQATSITINAVRTDTKSTLSGTGTFNLNYGNNRFTLNVRSESGSNRTYTINVSRPDLRGDDTTINSVSIGDISLEWNKEDSTQNILLVPNSVALAELSILLNESSSKVTSPLSQALIVGENSVEIVVQSEKGSTQSYPLMIVRADDQGNFPSKYTSTDIDKILLDEIQYAINQDMVRLPYNVEEAILSLVPVSSLTKVVIAEYGPFVFGDNNISVTLTAFDGTERTVVINFYRENQMNPVTLTELLENIDDYPIDTLSFFYEGLIIEEEILNTLNVSNKSFRVFVQTPSVLGYWFLSSEDSALLKDINFYIEEDTSTDFQKKLGFIVQTNIAFKESVFPKPIPFSFIQLDSLAAYESLYGYQMTEDGLQLIETWNVLPLTSTIEVGGPLHLVITPAQFDENVSELDSRYLLALIIGLGVGWLLLIISLFRNMSLRKKYLKLKKGGI
ncbi:MAG: cadherin-like beta sandwich domain-containing protein [Erysipelothrix sp.]|jgi:hypothetical protein|nr:cadherin-like beta sandwich domain-containing protein [Erysipelothrix sp.]